MNYYKRPTPLQEEQANAEATAFRGTSETVQSEL